ncbi:tRNA-dependent cyclodipeptide synthase [Spirillospora sp. CA-108201]
MPACRRLLDQGEHILIGVSPENSYFSRERIIALVKWAQRHFDEIDIVYVDQHIDTMYVASGYTPQKASARATRTIRDTRRRVRQAVEKSGGPDPRVRVRALSECVDLPGYQDTRMRIEERLGSDGGLQKACEEHVRYILRSRCDGASPEAEEAKLQAGLAYLYAEMPVLFNSPEILGVSSSVFCYHSIMPVLRHLYGTAIRNQAQGYIVAKPIERPLETRP